MVNATEVEFPGSLQEKKTTLLLLMWNFDTVSWCWHYGERREWCLSMWKQTNANYHWQKAVCDITWGAAVTIKALLSYTTLALLSLGVALFVCMCKMRICWSWFDSQGSWMLYLWWIHGKCFCSCLILSWGIESSVCMEQVRLSRELEALMAMHYQ